MQTEKFYFEMIPAEIREGVRKLLEHSVQATKSDTQKISDIKVTAEGVRQWAESKKSKNT